MQAPEYGVGSVQDTQPLPLAPPPYTGEGSVVIGQSNVARRSDGCRRRSTEWGALMDLGRWRALDRVAGGLDLGPETEVVSTPQTFLGTMLPFIERRVPVRYADIEAETL